MTDVIAINTNLQSKLFQNNLIFYLFFINIFNIFLNIENNYF